MAVKIENEKLFVTINEHGAELASLINKSNGMNYLWSGDSKYWGRKSPVLFPIEGAQKMEKCLLMEKNIVWDNMDLLGTWILKLKNLLRNQHVLN